MRNKQTTETTTKPKRRTTPRWAGTPGYSGNVNYGASAPVSKFNDSLFDSECLAGDGNEKVFNARR